MSEPETSPDLPDFVFNPDTPEFTADPYPTFTRLREEAPAYYWPAAKSYIISRYEDVAKLLRHPAFSPNPVDAGLPPGRETSLPPELRPLISEGLFRKSAVEHGRIRRVVGPAFGPRSVERLRPHVQAIVDDAIAGWAGAAEVEVTDVTNHVPHRVISKMFEIPPQHEKLFLRFSQAIIWSLDPRKSPEELAALFEPVPAGAAMLRTIVDERQKSPGNDLLSTLINARDEGESITADELVALIVTIVAAGAETTTHFFNFALHTFLREPERLALLRREPGLLRSALEETLRWDNFSKMGTPRFATTEVELAGRRFQRGDQLLALLPSALRDPRAFPDPDTFDPRRQPAESVQFGGGARFCLGVSLARLEGDVLFRTLLERFPYMRLAAKPEFTNHPFLREFASLRVALVPPEGSR
ncbi:MAG TPA: cytochrome P450 [Polyangiaceae bacterium]|nr:cytochrome P450 [Polyangiaceae bacterium]